MTLTRIHVNQHVVRRNTKTGERKPCLTVKTSKVNRYAHEVTLICPHCDRETGRVMYRPDKPLSCGAKVWIETQRTSRLTEGTMTTDRKCPTCGETTTDQELKTCPMCGRGKRGWRTLCCEQVCSICERYEQPAS